MSDTVILMHKAVQTVLICGSKVLSLSSRLISSGDTVILGKCITYHSLYEDLVNLDDVQATVTIACRELAITPEGLLTSATGSQ